MVEPVRESPPRAEGTLLTRILLLFKLAICAIERAWPRRGFRHGVLNRWSGNGSLLAANMAMVSFVFPPGTVAVMAWYCAENDIGLLNQAPDLSRWVALPLAFVAVDLAMWAHHWLLHRFDFLWRAHQVHHSDLDLDFTTGVRFHPFETFFTMTVRMLTVAAVGAPLVAAVAYELVVDAIGAFVHASLRVPERFDAALRLLLVTPDYHRVHHSAAPEMNRNYAVVLPIWDRLLGTYQAQPEKGHLDMELGLPDRRDAGSLHALALLLLPFRSLRG